MAVSIAVRRVVSRWWTSTTQYLWSVTEPTKDSHIGLYRTRVYFYALQCRRSSKLHRRPLSTFDIIDVYTSVDTSPFNENVIILRWMETLYSALERYTLDSVILNGALSLAVCGYLISRRWRPLNSPCCRSDFRHNNCGFLGPQHTFNIKDDCNSKTRTVSKWRYYHGHLLRQTRAFHQTYVKITMETLEETKVLGASHKFSDQRTRKSWLINYRNKCPDFDINGRK